VRRRHSAASIASWVSIICSVKYSAAALAPASDSSVSSTGTSGPGEGATVGAWGGVGRGGTVGIGTTAAGADGATSTVPTGAAVVPGGPGSAVQPARTRAARARVTGNPPGDPPREMRGRAGIAIDMRVTLGSGTAPAG